MKRKCLLAVGVLLLGCDSEGVRDASASEVFSNSLTAELEASLGAQRTRQLRDSAERVLFGDSTVGHLTPSTPATTESTAPAQTNAETVLTLRQDIGQVLDFSMLSGPGSPEEAFEQAMQGLENPLQPIDIARDSIVGIAEVAVAEVLREFSSPTLVSQIQVRASGCLQGECTNFVLLVRGGRDGHTTQVVNGKWWPWTREKLGYVFPPLQNGERKPPEVFRLDSARERKAFEQSLLAAGLTLEDAPK